MTYKLCYFVDGRKVQTLINNVPYSMCVAKRKEIERQGTHKIGKLAILKNEDNRATNW